MSRREPSSFCWFDYETFGISPVWDRPAQFAAIRTDTTLNVIGEPRMLYCRQSDDYLPHPAACRVTGLDPEAVNRPGLPECRFIEEVREWLGAPGTCSVGYNSIRFDDEFTRHTLFRNLHDPYEHEWKDGASRWDLLDVVRLTRALRPDGIEWPLVDGHPSNRLEHLAAANALEHGQAHDALSDVRATIALAALIRARQPKLFDYALAHRDKASVAALLEPAHRGPAEGPADGSRGGSPVVLVSSMTPASRHHLALIAPLARHPSNPNAVLVLDLAQDPEMLVGLDAEAIRARVFARGLPADDPTRIGLHSVALNKCPAVAPLAALRDEDAERLGIDRAAQLCHFGTLGRLLDARSCRGTTLRQSIREAFTRPFDEAVPDVDASLYAGGFLSSADRERLAAIRRAEPAAMAALGGRFDDPRLDEMLFRFRARNHPHTLDARERERWAAHVRARLLEAGADVPWLSREGFDRAMEEQDWNAAETPLREALARYAEVIGSRAAHPIRGARGARERGAREPVSP